MNPTRQFFPWLTVMLVVATFALTGCISNQPKLGGGSSRVTGSAGAAGTHNADKQMIKCARPIGTAALIEPGANGLPMAGYPGVYPLGLTGYTSAGLTSPILLVRLIMSQSGCFRVVDRGAASTALQRERAIAAGGQLQQNSNMGTGQMVAADYLITPAITRGNPGASGGLGGLGGVVPGWVGIGLAGLSVKNLEAQVMLSVTNVRSGVQEAIAEGSASKTDIGFGGLGWAGWVAGGGGAYQNTDLGKVVAAAFVDAHNNLVEQLRAIPGSLAHRDNAGFVTTARVNLRSGPSTTAPVRASIAKNTGLRHTGAAVAGWWEVDIAGQSGWIHSDYIAR